MSVIVEFRVQSSEFELGRILGVGGVSTIELESLVPVGEGTVPLFWIHDSKEEQFVGTVQGHQTVNDASAVDVFEDETLFALDWNPSEDTIFAGISTYDGQLLSAAGTPKRWKFELRFRTHESLSDFSEHCESNGISIEIVRVYRPTSPDIGAWYGLTTRQREALMLAVEAGYYDIPRRCTTKELGAELGISDQAVTERLRRAIASLATNTLIAPE